MNEAETIAVECPGCGARLRTKAANAGRRMPCPKCRTDIDVPGSVPPAPVTRTGTSASAAGKVIWRPRNTWTAVDRFWHRLGVTFVIFGALAHVLPHFGLQFRKLAGLGKAAPTAGTGIAVLGLFLIAYVWLLKGKLFRILVGAAAAVIVGFGALVLIGYFASNRRGGFPTPPQMTPPGGAGFAGGPGNPGQPGGYPGAGYQPGAGYPGAGAGPGSPGWTPPGAKERPVMDYDGFVERFGAERVVRVTFEGVGDPASLDLNKAINARIASWDDKSRPSTWFIRTRGVNKELTAGPVDDLAAFAARLDLGAVSGTDASQRRATIRVDQAKVDTNK